MFAPTSTIAFAGTTDVTGALFARDLEYAGELRVTYAAPAPRQEEPASDDMPPPSLH